MNTPGEAVIRQAEHDAHVDAELAQIGRTEQPPMSAAELHERARAAGAEVGGVVSSAELITIYNRCDGVSSKVTTDQLRQRLGVRFDPTHPWAGQLVWTTKPPDPAPRPGILRCPLHPESEERAYLDSLNLSNATCRKSNMRTEEDRNDHLEHKHNKVFRAMERDKERRMRERQMELMGEQTAAIQMMAGRQTEGSTEMDTPTIQAREEVTEEPAPPSTHSGPKRPR